MSGYHNVRRDNTEPSADHRVVAKTLWELYVALTGVGFSSDQAMSVVIATVTTTTAAAVE